MSTFQRPTGSRDEAHTPFVPPIEAAKLMHRNQSAIDLLDAWEAEGDEKEQRATMRVLRAALGADRGASSRNLFP